MYWCFREHNIMPSTYWNMGEGEKRIIRAFIVKEIEDRKPRE